jgi:hypothetical protein
MESVLSAIVVIFIVLFAVLTLSYAFISSQDMLQVTWTEMDARLGEQNRTNLNVEQAKMANAGTSILLNVRNSGDVKLADFEGWDVIAQYYDTAVPSVYHIKYLNYVEASPAGNEWMLAGIYADVERNIAESYETDILNSGEVAVLSLKLPVGIAYATQVQLTVVSSNGSGTSTIFVRNTPPVLVTNQLISMASGATASIPVANLSTTDVDNDLIDLIYTVVTLPQQGTLSLNSFTQVDIDGGLLSYTHTGSGSDTFEFKVSDGQDEIGSYIFAINVSEPPMLSLNGGLSVATGGSGVIGNSLLTASDVDNSADQLTYKITTLPTQGSLSQTMFTQADVDNGLLSYTHVGAGADSFQFTVTDGISTIGPFSFAITPV